MGAHFTSPLHFFILFCISLSYLTSIDARPSGTSQVKQIGQSIPFLLCPLKPWTPIFEFQPEGRDTWISLAYGENRRPDTPDRLKAWRVKTINGVEYVFYSLENLKKSDAGLYRCYYSTTNALEQHLTVSGPPEEPED